MRLESILAAWILSLWLGVGSTALAQSTVSFEADTASAFEGLGAAGLPVRLSAPPGVTASVHAAFAEVTASGGGLAGDYRGQNQVLVFAPTDTVRTVAFEIFDDARVEPNETFRITLSSPVNLALGAIPEVVFSILDDDTVPEITQQPVEVNFGSHRSPVPEGTGTVSIAVLLSAESEDPVTVPYQVTGGDAQGAGVDYTLPESEVTFDAFSKVAAIELDIVDDDDNEFEEDIELELGPPHGGIVLLGMASNHTVRIEDDDPVTAGWTTLTNAGEEALAATVSPVVELSAVAVDTVTVHVVLTGNAEPDGKDYRMVRPVFEPEEPPTHTPRAFALVIPPGQTTTSPAFRVVDDQLPELDETVGTVIYRVDNGLVATGQEAFTYTILDDDAAAEKPAIQFDRALSYLPETQSPEVNLVLEAASSQDVVCVWQVGGTATGGGTDYTLGQTSVLVRAGTTSTGLTFTVENDADVEPDESIQVVLVSASNATVGATNRYTHWILDDDRAREDITLLRFDIAAFESNRTLTVIGPKTATLRPHGIAVDAAGNAYITDHGPNKATEGGSVFMVPAGKREAIRIWSGLTQPGDIELTPDQRAMLVAIPEGWFVRKYFGVSVWLTNVDPAAGNTVVTVRYDIGRTKQATVSADGYFHFLDLMDADGRRQAVDVIIERGGRTMLIEDVPLGQPTQGGASFGHTILFTPFEP